MDLLYSLIIVFWLGVALIHSFNKSETGYSKLIVWLATICIASLSVGNLI